VSSIDYLPGQIHCLDSGYNQDSVYLALASKGVDSLASIFSFSLRLSDPVMMFSRLLEAFQPDEHNNQFGGFHRPLTR
jgi:hypothetical protein